MVHTFHGHVFEGYFNRFKTLIFILIEKFLALFTHKIITVSNSVRDELLALGICAKDKIKVIPLGLELNNFLSIPVRDSASINIGIIGRLAPIKNHFLFLEAAAQMIKTSPEIKLRFKIVGDGGLREKLEVCARKLNINAWVDFCGWQKDLVKVYADLDIVALTSINEGTPVSLIEAMASGRAIVATDVGGIRDLLDKERGIIVRQSDYLGFASALMVLVKDSQLRKKMGERGREFVQRVFIKERLINDMEKIIF